MSGHADFLKHCLPPVSYDANAVNLTTELNAVAKQLDTALVTADNLSTEMFADTTVQALLDWERVYGLPDPCVTIAQTIEQRRAALVSKVAALGGQSRAYFIGIAISMGYPDATIDEFQQMNCNSDCNAALNSEADTFYWQLNLPQSTGGVFYMDCNSDCNSALQSWGDEAIECRINKLKPAHTTALFAYP